ncbi:MAG: hypothetical protein HY744_01580 [Deltaproteobacteria bacterium]|nr:hypothetical protein [Deltaproteobacteria bacterium]
MIPRVFSAPLLFASALALCACGGGSPIHPETPTMEGSGDDQITTCKIAQDPLNPLIVEWPGTSKVDLEMASKRGVVVVSYAGCVLKILPGCRAQGSYEYTAVTPARESVKIATENELYANLPLGVATLKGELAQGARLELAYVAVGQRSASKAPASLGGECAGATHYVRTLTVGAFSLETVTGSSVGGGVAVAGVEAGGGSKESRRHLRGSGDMDLCGEAADATASSACSAVLQLGLAPLGGSGSGMALAGFGAGLGSLSAVPTVQSVPDLPVAAGNLADVDVELLTAIQNAKRADRSGSVSPDQKAEAWDALARYPGTNPMKVQAEERRDAWRQVAEARKRREEQVAKACTQFVEDNSKLYKLLALDDEVVSASQKSAYRSELVRTYAGWKEASPDCIGRGLASFAPGPPREQAAEPQPTRPPREQAAGKEVRSGSSTAGVVLSVLGVASLAGTATFAGLNVSNNNALDQGDFATASDMESARDTGRIFNVGLVVSAVAGVALLGVGIPLWISGANKQDPPSSSATLRLAPAGVLLEGRH